MKDSLLNIFVTSKVYCDSLEILQILLFVETKAKLRYKVFEDLTFCPSTSRYESLKTVESVKFILMFHFINDTFERVRREIPCKLIENKASGKNEFPFDFIFRVNLDGVRFSNCRRRFYESDE